MSAYKKKVEGQQFTYNQIHNIYNSELKYNKQIDFLVNQDKHKIDENLNKENKNNDNNNENDENNNNENNNKDNIFQRNKDNKI